MQTVHINDEGVPPEPARPIFAELTLDALKQLRDEAKRQRDEASDYLGAIDQELVGRILAAHPGYGPESGGSAKAAGDYVVAKLTYARQFDYDESELASLVSDELITATEYEGLIKRIEVHVDGTKFNSLLRLGGAIAERLMAARKLKSARPVIEWERRA